MKNIEPSDSQDAIMADIAAVANIDAVPSILKIICAQTGMGFAAVARVTEGNWTALAVHDDIQFGLLAGAQLGVKTTLCSEARASRLPIAFDHASASPVYRDHPTPKMYNIESYISVPIIRPDGEYFGNLCAIDPKPRSVSDQATVKMFTAFASLIALQLGNEAQHQRVVKELQAEKNTAELREQFIAVLGHDMRGPLSAIRMGAEVLVRRPEPDLVSMGKRLLTSGNRMAALIDDVLDFARGRLGAGMEVATGAIADVSVALTDVVMEVRTSYPERKIVHQFSIDRVVHGDRSRIQQLFSNLLANAVTHGSADFPVLVEAATSRDWLTMVVWNSGEPIEPDNLARVFEPYWRPHKIDRQGGLGLGLYISAQIAKAHGGSLSVTSSAKEGTAFTARIPLRQERPA